MAIVMEANYSKKLGLPGYSSHQYSVSLKVEVADLTKIEAASQEVHAILQSSVDREIQKVGFLPETNGNGNGNSNGHSRPNGNGNGNGHHSGDHWNCSDKQRKLIEDIVNEKRLDKSGVEQLALDRFGKGVKALNKLEASGLNTWLQCRLKFYFRYVAQVKKRPTQALHIGKVVHAVLQGWNMARWRKQPFAVEQFKTLFENDWKERQTKDKVNWDGEEEGERNHAWLLLETYFLETPIKANEMPEAVEVPVEAELPGLPKLIGIIDLVRSGGRIVDFKTAGQTPTSEKAAHMHETQTSCYAVLYREATGKCSCKLMPSLKQSVATSSRSEALPSSAMRWRRTSSGSSLVTTSTRRCGNFFASEDRSCSPTYRAVAR